MINIFKIITIQVKKHDLLIKVYVRNLKRTQYSTLKECGKDRTSDRDNNQECEYGQLNQQARFLEVSLLVLIGPTSVSMDDGGEGKSDDDNVKDGTNDQL